jgi:hypothetical protein
LFTRDFKKVRVALGAVGVAALLYAGTNTAFLTLSSWVEGHTIVYPYQDEDWLRYLLSALFENRGENRIMLVGESAVRENLLYEEFNRAFPHMQTFQGGLSAGTIDDLLISLEYIEKVYGSKALPRVLVVGVSPRFAANIPNSRPFLDSIQRYSPYFGVAETSAGPRLTPKTSWQGWFSWLRFVLFKQQKRYLASFSALARSVISIDPMESVQAPLPSKREVLRSLLRQPLETTRQIFRTTVATWNRRWTSPYKYHDLQPGPVEGLRAWLRSPGSFWRKVHSWNPETSQQMIVDRFGRLRAFTDKQKIHLYVINLPENIESRQLYEQGNYERYLSLVRKNLGDVPYLDLRQMLNPGEFYDVVHATLPGANRVTQRVIHFIKEQRDDVTDSRSDLAHRF